MTNEESSMAHRMAERIARVQRIIEADPMAEARVRESLRGWVPGPITSALSTRLGLRFLGNCDPVEALPGRAL